MYESDAPENPARARSLVFPPDVAPFWFASQDSWTTFELSYWQQGALRRSDRRESS